MVMAAIAPPSAFGSPFRIDADTRIAVRSGVRATVRLGTRALIRHRCRCVSAVRADAGALEGDDVVAVQKTEKQRKTDGEHDVSPCGDSYVRIASTARPLRVAHANGTRG